MVVSRWSRTRYLTSSSAFRTYPGWIARNGCISSPLTASCIRARRLAVKPYGRLPGGWLWILPFHVPGSLAVAEHLYAWIARRWGPTGTAPSGERSGVSAKETVSLAEKGESS